jgi:hypothetical protein
MIFGMTAFTFVHVVLSLIGIVAGAVVMYGLVTAKRLEGWTVLFFAAMVATSVTGFGFSSANFLPSHWVGVISLVVLAVAILARYVFHLAGPWRWIFVVAVVAAFYFDVFVAIVQAFQKIPALRAIAPTQSEPAFAIAQLAALALFIVLGIVAVVASRREAAG